MQKERRKKHSIAHLPWNERWKPCAAFIYLIICFFDFIVVPTFIGLTRPSYTELIPVIKGLDVSIQNSIIMQYRRWEPLTVSNGGLFHVAFGAILGVSAFNRYSPQAGTSREDEKS